MGLVIVLDSQVHENKHMDNFEKDPLKTIKNFQGLYCGRCGGLMDLKQLEKHKCKIKI